MLWRKRNGKPKSPKRTKLEQAADRLIKTEGLKVARIVNVGGITIRSIQLWREDGVLLAELRLNANGDVLRVFHKLYMRANEFDEAETEKEFP